jgi:hypothetical protein
MPTEALSPEARKYLAEVFDCTTLEHLRRFNEPDGTLNVFEENIEHNDGEDDVSLDREIAAYLKTQKTD